MTPDPSIADLCTFLAALGDAAAAQTLPRFRKGVSVSNKLEGDFDPVTEADRMAEKQIRTLIQERYPDHGILGEEWGLTKGKDPWRWVIDPVDGTRAFICGAPVWTTLIGVEFQGVPVAGLIDQPFTGERWIGGRGLPAGYMRHGTETDARVSTCTALSDARLMVTDIRSRGGYFTQAESEAVQALSLACKVIRQGLDSYGFGLVALGEMDLVVEASLSWYDIAGALPVIEAAGGVAITWDGAPVREPFDRGRVIIASTQELADAARKKLLTA
ncbi:MAG: inositol monophosphatase family protein [Parvularcula sp.]